jgi:hypothetical protein
VLEQLTSISVVALGLSLTGIDEPVTTTSMVMSPQTLFEVHVSDSPVPIVVLLERAGNGQFKPLVAMFASARSRLSAVVGKGQFKMPLVKNGDSRQVGILCRQPEDRR